MKAIIITAIICLTLFAICYVNRNENKKGGDKHDK